MREVLKLLCHLKMKEASIDETAVVLIRWNMDALVLVLFS
jgi:hypothetical protein